METAAIVVEHDFDAETLAELQSLRMIRLCIAEKQLADVPKTMTEMISRGLVNRATEHERAEELRKELKAKVSVLKGRTSASEKVVYLDEIEFYLRLVTEE